MKTKSINRKRPAGITGVWGNHNGPDTYMVLECSYLSSARDWNDIENSRRVVESEMSPVFDAYLGVDWAFEGYFDIHYSGNSKLSRETLLGRFTQTVDGKRHARFLIQQSRNSGRYRYSISTDMLITYHYYRMYPRDGFPRLVTSIWVWDKKLGNFVESRMSSAVCLSQLVLPFDPRCSAPSLLDWDISEKSNNTPWPSQLFFEMYGHHYRTNRFRQILLLSKEDVVQ